MSPTKPFEFEKHLRELEDITAWFESKDANLDEGIAKFERGMELAQQLKSHLASVENRVEKIRQKFSANDTLPRPETDSTAQAQPTAELDDSPQAGLFA